MLQIQKLGLEKIVMEMKAKGMSTRQIEDELSRNDVNISHMSISRYLNSDSEVKKEVIQKSEELKEKLAEEELDIYQQLIDANRLVLKKIDEIKDSTEHYALQGYLKELRAQSELLIRQLGELKADKQSVTISYIQENLLQIAQELTDEQVKKLMIYLIENREGLQKIRHIDIPNFIHRTIRDIEDIGYIMIKIPDNEDTETKHLIKTLDEEGKIEILSRKTQFM